MVLILGRHVEMLDDCIGPDVVVECLDPVDGSVILLENLRFHIEEQGEGNNVEQKKIVAPRLLHNFQKYFRASVLRMLIPLQV